MPRLLPLAAPLLLAACGPHCGAAADLTPGEVQGTLDGADWGPVAATWRAAATGVSIVAPPADGWRLTLVAQLTDEGLDVVSHMDGGMPLQVVLGTGSDGGWALLNGTNPPTFTTGAGDGGGWLRLLGQEGNDLFGCTDFTASDGHQSKRAAVAFRATPGQ